MKFVLLPLKKQVNVTKGRSAGWPDLVAWNHEDVVFAEVKSSDTLSETQKQWINFHKGVFKVEIIRILAK